MVEKGDQGLDETPSSSFEEIPLTAGIARATEVELPTVEDVDSDDDRSKEEADEALQGRADTKMVDELNVISQAHYDDSGCLVILSTQVKGHSILYGFPKASCSPTKHRVL
jgi:hypothetical protein